MKIIITFVLIFFLSVSAYANVDVANVGKKFVFTDWLQDETLKWGYVGSLCGYQALNGMCEGYHFRQEKTNLINGNNYHAFVTAQRLAGITTGWFMYGNIRNKHQGWFNTCRRLLGGALISRNCFEWSYKYTRYGNPFDYSKAHNKHAMVYFGWKDGSPVDLYISTGPVSGPIVDIASIFVGWLILK